MKFYQPLKNLFHMLSFRIKWMKAESICEKNIHANFNSSDQNYISIAKGHVPQR